MKKRIWFLILFFVFSLCLGSTFFADSIISACAEEIPFYQQLADIEWDYGYIHLDKSASINEVCKSLSIKGGDYANIPLSTNPMGEEEIESLCAMNGYVLEDKGDYFQARHMFSLKSLICMGEVKNNYGATKVIEGYLDFSVHFFESQEQTQYAYEMMLQDGVHVTINDVVKLNSADTVINPTNFNAGTYKTWGASYMGMNDYKAYLNTNNSGKEVVVAVIDSGINSSHELTRDRILKDKNGNWVGTSFVGASTYTYNNCVFEDDLQEYNPYTGKYVYGHGAHVSGIIADLTPDNVKILPIKVFDRNGYGTMTDMVSVMEILEEYAQTYNIVCVNMSLGSSISEEYKNIYGEERFNQEIAQRKIEFDAVVNRLKDNYNILTIAAAGNESVNTKNIFPANCDNAVTVSALRQNNTSCAFESGYSNYGPMVKISAPGSSINSVQISSTNTANVNGYEIKSGTSMATPHVSAAVALLCADKMYYSGNTAVYDVDDIAARLYDNSVDLGSGGRDIYYGYGMLYLGNVPKPIEYSVGHKTVTYNGEYHNIEVGVTGVADYTITYGLSAGTYNITNIATNDIFKNYTNGAKSIYFKITADGWLDTTGVGNLTINKASITINVQSQTTTYGTFNFNNKKFTVASGQIYSGDENAFTLTTTATVTSGVGPYNIKLNCTNSNYEVSSNTAILTINPKPITIKINNQNSIYGDNVVLSNSYELTNGSKLVGSDKLTITTTTVADKTSDFGTYDITLKSYNNPNYSVTAVNGTLTIEKRRVDIKLQPQTQIYSSSYVFEGAMYTVLSSNKNVVTGDNLGLVLATRENITGKGVYTLYMSSYTNENYIVSASDSTFEVTAKNISVTLPNQEFVYGDNVTLNKNGYTIGQGLLSGDNLNIELSCSVSGKVGVGSYPITLTYNNNNYNLTYNQASIVVKPKLITISIADYEFTYGEVNLSIVEFDIAAGSTVGSDEINIELKNTIDNTTGVGSYTLQATANNNNYVVVVEGGRVEILAKKITLTTNQTSVYGDEIIFDNSVYQIIEGNVINGDNLNLQFCTDATASSQVGQYNIDVLSCNQNYDITVDGNITITKRPLIVSLHDQKLEYGDEVKLSQTAYSVKTTLPSDISKEDLNIVLSLKEIGTNVGSYNIIAACADENYDFSFLPAELKIQKRKLTIVLDDQKVTFSQNMTLNGNAYRVVSGSFLAGDSKDIKIYCTANNISPFGGRYVLSASSENENYDLTVINSVLTVEADRNKVLIVSIAPPAILIVVVGLICIFGSKRKKKNIEF